MFDEDFEWDDRKADENWRKHGIDFEWAKSAFRDAFAIENIDERQVGELRINMLAMCEGILLHLTYTERETRVRVISARRATKHEQDRYYRENSHD